MGLFRSVKSERSPSVAWHDVLFWALLVVHLMPVLAFRWFPTLDGPCHLQNARIVLGLVRGDALTAQFFMLNPFPEPNWLGHVLMAATLAIAPAFIAEKSVVLCFVIGFPLAFRYLITRFPDHDRSMSLLAFPFVMSYPLRMGFFNFSLGLVLMLLVAGWWYERRSTRTVMDGWKLSLFLVALYFTHLAVLMLTIGLLAALTWWPPDGERSSSAVPRKPALGHLVLSALPAIALVVAYFIHHNGKGYAPSRFPPLQILEWFMNGRPFVALTDAEVPYTRMIGMGLLIGLLAILVHSRRRGPKFWALACGAMIAATFVLPDAMAGGKFLTPRLMLLSMLFAAIGSAACRSPRWIAWPTLLLVTIADLLALKGHHERTAGLARDVEEFMSVAGGCGPGSILLPLNHSDNWMHSNFSSYIGAERGTLVLDNFLAHTPTSPVLWKPGSEPDGSIGDFDRSRTPCVSLAAFQRNMPEAELFISTWRMGSSASDSCAIDARAQLDLQAFKVLSSGSGDALLFQLR